MIIIDGETYNVPIIAMDGMADALINTRSVPLMGNCTVR